MIWVNFYMILSSGAKGLYWRKWSWIPRKGVLNQRPLKILKLFSLKAISNEFRTDFCLFNGAKGFFYLIRICWRPVGDGGGGGGVCCKQELQKNNNNNLFALVVHDALIFRWCWGSSEPSTAEPQLQPPCKQTEKQKWEIILIQSLGVGVVIQCWSGALGLPPDLLLGYKEACLLPPWLNSKLLPNEFWG